MKYSEAKAIVRQLHDRGWRKLPLFPGYEKEWTRGERRYRLTFSFTEAARYKEELEEFLQRYEDKAHQKLGGLMFKQETTSVWPSPHEKVCRAVVDCEVALVFGILHPYKVNNIARANSVSVEDMEKHLRICDHHGREIKEVLQCEK